MTLFIETHDMMNTCDSHIAGWNADGTKCIIEDIEKFVAGKFLPQFFNHNNFESFTRQLGFYGFTRTITQVSLGLSCVDIFHCYLLYMLMNNAIFILNLQRENVVRVPSTTVTSIVSLKRNTYSKK